jgi:hypothetical protein
MEDDAQERVQGGHPLTLHVAWSTRTNGVANLATPFSFRVLIPLSRIAEVVSKFVILAPRTRSFV